MIRFSKMFFYVTVAVLLVWQLPWCYAFLTLKPANNRSTVCYLLFTYVSLRQTNVFPIPFAVGQLVRKTSS